MPKNPTDISDFAKEEINSIWSLAENKTQVKYDGTVAWSFEGNGIRTISSFIIAFQRLGLNYIELPYSLKTYERIQDLSYYLDSFFNAYVIRESDKQFKY